MNYSEKNLKYHIENIDILGYSVMENVISEKECKTIAQKLDKINQNQINDFSISKLNQLQERGFLRTLIYHDEYFGSTITNEKVFSIIGSILGDTAILHLQNGIITESDFEHWGSKFHRDFNKPFFSDKPLSINAFWVIDEFNENTGGTWIVPYSHKFLSWPSDDFLNSTAIQITANPGSVIFFDSRIIHKGGINKSNKPRRAINHQFTLPFIKQQIDFPSMLKDKIDKESKLAQTLGFWTIPPKSIEEFRADPENRTYRSGQG